MKRVPIWTRGSVYYYTDGRGRRISLKTKDRNEALKRYKQQTAKGAAAPTPKPVRTDPPDPAPPPPPPPAPPPPTPVFVPSPGESGPPGGGAAAGLPPERPDPLHMVGATAAEPPPGDDDGEDDVDPDSIPPSPAEIEAAATEMATVIVSIVGSVTAGLAERRHGRVGIIRRETYQRNVDNWKIITRRWAAEWRMGPWTAITLSTIALAKEQWTCEAGTIDPDTGEAAQAGVQPHASAA